MAKLKTKIGAVFSAQIDNNSKKYFQYIANDLTQLNSDVIRVFKSSYKLEAKPDISDIVKDEVDFYAHSITDLGLKLKFWKIEGNVGETGNLNKILFRNTNDMDIY